MLRHIREFFYQRNVLEVETPLLASAGVTDPYLVNFETQYLLPGESRGKSLFLQTSPEPKIRKRPKPKKFQTFKIYKEKNVFKPTMMGIVPRLIIK